MTETSKKTTTKPTKKKDTLKAALLRAQMDVGSIHRDGRNAHHKFDYVLTDSMVAQAKHALNDNGLFVVIKQTKLRRDDLGLLLQWNQFELSHPESDESDDDYETEIPVCPGKGRPEDKASLSSNSSALKYFYRNLLQIPMVDEEICARDDSNYTGKEVVEKIEKIKKTGNKPDPKSKVSQQQVTTLRNLCKSKKTPEARSSFKDEMYRFLGLDKDAPIEDAPAVAAEHFIQHSTNDNLPI